MLLKRLQNLWKLSEYEPMKKEDNNNLPIGTKVSSLISKPQMAQFIKPSAKNEIDNLVNQ
jgi:hypothetical protein